MVLGGKIISTVLGTEPFFQRLKERNSPLKDWKYDRMMTSEEWQERLHGQKRPSPYGNRWPSYRGNDHPEIWHPDHPPRYPGFDRQPRGWNYGHPRMLPPPYNYDEYGPLDDESEESESMDTFDDDESYVRRRPPYGRKPMPRYGGIPARGLPQYYGYDQTHMDPYDTRGGYSMGYDHPRGPGWHPQDWHRIRRPPHWARSMSSEESF